MESLFKGIPSDMFSSILIHNPDPILLLDEKGKVVDINLAAAEVFGYSLSEWKDGNIRDKIAPEYINDSVQSFEATLKGQYCSFQISIREKSGRLLHLQAKSIPLLDGAEIQKVLIVSKDMTELIETKNELQKTAGQLRFFYESSAEAMDIIGLDGNVIQVNRAFEEMYGWKEEEIVGSPMPTIPAERAEQVSRDRALVLKGQSIKSLEVDCFKKDGTSIPVSITLSPLHDEKGNVIAFSGISRDISERKKIEEALIRSEEKYRLIAENMTDIVTVLNKEGIITYASPSTTHVLGFPLESYVGSTAFNMVHPEDLRGVQKQYYAIFESKGSGEMEFRYKHKTKGWIWLEAKGTYFTDEEKGDRHLLVVSRVIEEKKRMREKLQQMAFHDELTELPNRRLFKEIMLQNLKAAKRKKEKCALLFMDIDKFKWVNDHLGHSIGDELLKQFSGRVRLSLRESDVFARQGGDEFLILLPHTNEEEAITISNRILESLQEEWHVGEHFFTTTSSIGIALYPQHATNMEDLLTNADDALYKAKQLGRNTVMVF